MKKTLFMAFGCILAVGANAQTLKPTGRVLLNNESFYSVASQYTIDGKSILYAECEEGFEIWGDDLAVERTITVPSGVNGGRYVTEQRSGTVVGTTTNLDYDFDKPYRWMVWRNVENSEEKEFTLEYLEEFAEHLYGTTDSVLVKKDGERTRYYYYYSNPNRKDCRYWFLCSVSDANQFDFAMAYCTDRYVNGYGWENDEVREWTNLADTVPFFECNISEYYKAFAYSKKNNIWDKEFMNAFLQGYIDGDFKYDFGGLDWYTNYTVSAKEGGNGAVQFVVSYFEPALLGEQCPTIYWEYDGYENIVLYKKSYEISYTGEWISETTYSEYSDELVGWVGLRDADYVEDSQSATLTQTLFNNDAEMEYIRRKFESVANEESSEEQDRDGDGEIDYKYTVYRNKTVGFEIVNESGEVLSYIPVVDSRNTSYLDCNILKFRGKHYLLVENCRQTVDGEEGWDGMDYVYFYDVYIIDKNANSIQKVKSTSPIRVSPAVAERNTIINVTLGDVQAEKGGELIVSDSNGRMVNRHRVEVGQKQVPVMLEGVSSGVYNVTLNQMGHNVENTRVIVK